MSTINPYISRKPVVNPAHFYDRKEVLAWIIRQISAPSPQSCSLVGEVRIGKTSLLHFMADPNGARASHPFAEVLAESPYLFVLLPLQGLPARNKLGFWRYLFARLAQEAKKAGLEQPELASLYDEARRSQDGYTIHFNLEQYLIALPARIIILFDDFEVMVNDLELAESEKLRALAMSLELSDKLAYVITSRDPLPQLWERKGVLDSVSPFWNVVHSQDLGLFSSSSAIERFIGEPAQKSGITFSKQDVALIIELAGKHPNFIKVACTHLFEAKLNGSIDDEALRQTIMADNHLSWLMRQLWQRILKAEEEQRLPLRATLLALAQGKEALNPIAQRNLSARGIVDHSSGVPKIFAGIFQDFILKKEKINLPFKPPPTPPKRFTAPAAIDPNAKKQEIDLAESRQTLTSLEFKLLSHLVEQIGRTCSREELREAIWQDNQPSSRDALEQLVRRVRQKIEENPRAPKRLLTVRGQGYLFRNQER